MAPGFKPVRLKNKRKAAIYSGVDRLAVNDFPEPRRFSPGGVRCL